MQKQWSELSKTQQREAKDWFNRIFANAHDEHGNSIEWDTLEENERALAYGKLWKYHHDRNKPDHAFMKEQDRKRKVVLRAKEQEFEKYYAEVRCENRG